MYALLLPEMSSSEQATERFDHQTKSDQYGMGDERAVMQPA
jgi:hypothetical protein